MIIAPAVQGLLVAKVRGIKPSNRLLFGLACWMMTYGTVPLFTHPSNVIVVSSLNV